MKIFVPCVCFEPDPQFQWSQPQPCYFQRNRPDLLFDFKPTDYSHPWINGFFDAINDYFNIFNNRVRSAVSHYQESEVLIVFFAIWFKIAPENIRGPVTARNKFGTGRGIHSEEIRSLIEARCLILSAIECLLFFQILDLEPLVSEGQVREYYRSDGCCRLNTGDSNFDVFLRAIHGSDLDANLTDCRSENLPKNDTIAPLGQT